jgi:hypothetical protein
VTSRPIEAIEKTSTSEVSEPQFSNSGAPTSRLKADQEFRGILLGAYLDFASPGELSDWLRDIACDPKGTPEVKRDRIRKNTKFPTMSPDEFRKCSLQDLADYSTDELAEMCHRLKLDEEGAKSHLVRRLYRELGYREGWLDRLEKGAKPITKKAALPFINWYPLLKEYSYEQDAYGDFMDEMGEVFGDDSIHDQFAVAHGVSLKIDFHLGAPISGGLGIEFKLPTSNSELQRGLGQIDQYINRYGTELVVVLFPHLIKNAEEQLFVSELEKKRVTVVVKKKSQSRD